MEGITPQQVTQLLISFVGGGLAGSVLTILFNFWNAKRIATAKEKGMIETIAAELRASNLLCAHNAKLQAYSIAPFIHFPTIAACNVAFEERHSYPRLASIIQDIEYYTLGVMQVNEMIDQYRLLIYSYDTSLQQHGKDRDDLRNQIAAICKGDSKLEGTGPENFLILPTFIEVLAKRVESLL
jgi:hypothetical protein